MIYGYIRVSTDRQTVENQRFEINNFCEREKILIDRWIEETVSGTKQVEERQLGKLLKKLKKGDILICAELSRLGRSLLMIMSILHHCMKNEIQVWTIKDNFRLGKDIQSQVLAFAFGLSAQIERDLISMRTKEALARKRAEGIVLGRPVGKKSTATKLTGMESKIKGYLDINLSHAAIGRLVGCHRLTVAKFIDEHIYNKKIIGDSDIEMDPITAKQLSKLIDHKNIVLHLIKNRKSILSISQMYKVEPFVVQMFKAKFSNETPNKDEVDKYEAKQQEDSLINSGLKKLEKDSETIKMLLGSGQTYDAIATMYNVPVQAVAKFKLL